MAGIKYSKKQVEELLKNKYVKDCTQKYISFTDEFKIKVLELDSKWIYHRKIFQELWFPEYICISNVVNRTLRNLRHNLKTKWKDFLLESKKWRKKVENININKMTLLEQNEYLKTENAVLKEMYKLKYWKYP